MQATESRPPLYPISRVLNLFNFPFWARSYGPFLTAVCISISFTILLLTASIVSSLTGHLKENLFPVTICIALTVQLLGGASAIVLIGDVTVDARGRLTTVLEANGSRILYAWRSIAILFELFYCFFTVSVIVNFFHPFLFFPSDEPYVKHDGSKTHYFWGEFTVFACPILAIFVLYVGLWFISRYPRLAAVIGYLA